MKRILTAWLTATLAAVLVVLSMAGPSSATARPASAAHPASTSHPTAPRESEHSAPATRVRLEPSDRVRLEPSHVALVLSTSTVRTGQMVSAVATVTPVAPGRIVTLRVYIEGRLTAGLVARTDAAGTAMFHTSFRHAGSVHFRAFVRRTVTASAGFSHAVVEQVIKTVKIRIAPRPVKVAPRPVKVKPHPVKVAPRPVKVKAKPRPVKAVPRPVTVPLRPSHLRIAVEAPAVRQGQPARIIADVTPRTSDRVVTLRIHFGGHVVGALIARTNPSGRAVFTTSFPEEGTVLLQASVSGAFSGSIRWSSGWSRVAVEDVAPHNAILLPPGDQPGLGAVGAGIAAVQQRLLSLGYWVESPDGTFDDSTQQAIFALQKVAGIARTGTVDPQTLAALNAGVVPTPRSTSGNVIEVDLEDDVLMIVQNGKLFATLNTSTGGGYSYFEDGQTDVATTPTGTFTIGRTVDGTVTDTLGTLWRPRFFYEGYAIHGDSYVPPFPESHGCVRVSDEAINWIWADNLAPVGTEVWLY